MEFAELVHVETENSRIQAYDGLAEFWHEYTSLQMPDYTSFIDRLMSIRGIRPEAILDLACGTGTLTARLSGSAAEVVGLDQSETMLSHARIRCKSISNVQFVRGEFPGFELNRCFNAIVCPANSMNYVRTLSELNHVFRTVAKHLQPGGVFVFDTLTSRAMTVLSTFYLHITVDRGRFVMRFQFDPARRQQKALVILPAGVEEHIQIPIDPIDVIEAANGTDLIVDDYFSSAIIPGRWCTGYTSFFVLTKRL